ncbi:hypothetical protein TRV_03481 [Trichophyton verrucosum HKI 0517]|uniref:Uncharacterized protein n=1 Tax=Trichophyton verrucosum (strain HKI 0517) TaxID=663202 RepID=D4D8P4_TRIVH|nr:uncharacterized protein TRV_03481 [Trichophyton verrucosum HKI 0517]EFE41799.1 hypothetical protein TRV_03481 [Trichophyton verrucosum HKI 0517]
MYRDSGMCVHLSEETEVGLKYEEHDGFGQGFAGLDQVVPQGDQGGHMYVPGVTKMQGRVKSVRLNAPERHLEPWTNRDGQKEIYVE